MSAKTHCTSIFVLVYYIAHRFHTLMYKVVPKLCQKQILPDKFVHLHGQVVLPVHAHM